MQIRNIAIIAHVDHGKTTLVDKMLRQAGVFRVAPGGRIARHPATVPQILAVLEGSGSVSGADGQFQPIGVGEAVFWPAGEEHEMRTDGGLTALVLEAEGLLPRLSA